MGRITATTTDARVPKKAKIGRLEQLDKLLASASPSAAARLLVERSSIMTFLDLDRRTFTQEQVMKLTGASATSIQNWITRGMLGDDVKKGIKASAYSRRMYRPPDIATIVLGLALIKRAGLPAAGAFAHSRRIVLAIQGLAIYDDELLRRLADDPKRILSFCWTGGLGEEILDNETLVFPSDRLIEVMAGRSGAVLQTGWELWQVVARARRLT